MRTRSSSTATVAPEKGSRLLWRDPEDGAWREHVVARTDEPLTGARAGGTPSPL